MPDYEFNRIEKKWQKRWMDEKTYAAVTGDPHPLSGQISVALA